MFLECQGLVLNSFRMRLQLFEADIGRFQDIPVDLGLVFPGEVALTKTQAYERGRARACTRP